MHMKIEKYTKKSIDNIKYERECSFVLFTKSNISKISKTVKIFVMKKYMAFRVVEFIRNPIFFYNYKLLNWAYFDISIFIQIT